jgi:putative tricarboxylic transport membrane protein
VSLEWPILRGLYLGAQVSERDYREWTSALTRAMDSGVAAQELEKAGMQRYWLTGPDLDNLVQSQLKLFDTLATEFGLNRR